MGRHAALVVRRLLMCLLVVSIATSSSAATVVERTDAIASVGTPSAGAGLTGTAALSTTVAEAPAVGTHAAQAGVPESIPGVSLAVSRVSPTELEITTTYDVPASIEDLRVVAAGVDVREAEGFSECGSNRLCWDGSADPSLTMGYDLSAYAGTYTGIVNDSVVFVPAPRIYTIWRTSEDRGTAPLFAKAEYATYEVSGRETVVGNATLFHGPHTEYERTTGSGTTVRLIIPENVRLGPSRDRLFDTLNRASEALDVGGVNREVIAVALADTPQSTDFGLAGATVGNAFWARSGGSLTSTHNVWLHEYVHTRQRFADRGREMEWFVEASAEYYAARLAYELGLVSDIEYEWEMKSRRVGVSDSTLADPATWDGPNVPYRKGALTLAALDAEVRERTDGERTLEDVFRRLNEGDETLTYEVFVDTVVAVSGDRTMEHWLDRYIKGSETPQYEPRDPQSRLPNPPRMTAVTALVPTTPLGFGAAAVGLMIATMLTLSVLSIVSRSLQRLVEAIFDTLSWLADVLSGRRP